MATKKVVKARQKKKKLFYDPPKSTTQKTLSAVWCDYLVPSHNQGTVRDQRSTNLPQDFMQE